MKEICSECGEETGKAGRCEDSLYLINNIVNKEVGPLCESCYSDFLQNSTYKQDY